MLCYLEVIAVMAVALIGVLLGRLSSSLRKPYWCVGYFISLSLIALLILGRYYYVLNFIPPFDYLLGSRARFIILCLAVTLGITTPLNRLPYHLEQVLACVLMGIVVAWFSVMPFLAPAVLRGRHESLETRITTEGLCFQTTDYTCGPAAAVTALGKLGIKAEEGRLAVLAYSSPVIGTLPVCLSDAINSEYASYGLSCEFERYDSVAELQKVDVTLAVVKDRFLNDHCVAVLEVDDESVLIADPASGKHIISHEKFAQIWRFSGIAIRKNADKQI